MVTKFVLTVTKTIWLYVAIALLLHCVGGTAKA